jgi:hypothetical protein
VCGIPKFVICMYLSHRMDVEVENVGLLVVGHWSVTARLQRVQVVDVEEMAGDRNTRKGSKLIIKRIRSLGHAENASK